MDKTLHHHVLISRSNSCRMFLKNQHRWFVFPNLKVKKKVNRFISHHSVFWKLYWLISGSLCNTMVTKLSDAALLHQLHNKTIFQFFFINKV